MRSERGGGRRIPADQPARIVHRDTEGTFILMGGNTLLGVPVPNRSTADLDDPEISLDPDDVYAELCDADLYGTELERRGLSNRRGTEQRRARKGADRLLLADGPSARSFTTSRHAPPTPTRLPVR